MSSSFFPPKPDLRTGEPRPPSAPLEKNWTPAISEDPDKASVPEPPAGQGPVLEWYQGPGSGGTAAAFFMILGIVVLTWRFWGFDWVHVWYLWAILLAFSAILYFANRRGERLSAGADWYWYKRSYVKIYELTSVTVRGAAGGAAWALDLEDAGGRKVSTQLQIIQRSPALWDLVYNGILHSVYTGGAKVNKRARDRLHLPDRG